MPKFSMTQEEAIVLTWLVAEGDSVKKGDPIMEVETDKVAMEVEAPEDGVIQGMKVREGDIVPVTEVIAYIVPEGEKWKPDIEITSGTDIADIDGSSKVPDEGENVIKATPVARRLAASAEISLDDIPPPENDHRIRRQHVEQYIQNVNDRMLANGKNLSVNPDKLRATPAARRLARERSLSLDQIEGTGPRKRIQAEDVTHFQQAKDTPGTTDLSTELGADRGELVPFDRMRRTIANRMLKNYQSIPHITFTVAADMTVADELRQRLNSEKVTAGNARVSVTAVIAKVCAWALGRHPQINASWSDEGIQLNKQVNIGVAVALENGLIVPVIQNANALGLSMIADQILDLTAKAKKGRLQLNEVQGGTFTISNLGMFGIDQFTAIIAAPQSAILAVGRTKKQPVVIEKPTGDELEIRPMMKMTLSVDHRVIDGAMAAQFMADVVTALEQPDRMLW
jgi:pyruvate dehydrogenase E2 component (dihydrolipoamide acetyltransferase)